MEKMVAKIPPIKVQEVAGVTQRTMATVYSDLAKTSKERDISVMYTIDDKLKFEDHMAEKVNK